MLLPRHPTQRAAKPAYRLRENNIVELVSHNNLNQVHTSCTPSDVASVSPPLLVTDDAEQNQRYKVNLSATIELWDLKKKGINSVFPQLAKHSVGEPIPYDGVINLRKLAEVCPDSDLARSLMGYAKEKRMKQNPKRKNIESEDKWVAEITREDIGVAQEVAGWIAAGKAAKEVSSPSFCTASANVHFKGNKEKKSKRKARQTAEEASEVWNGQELSRMISSVMGAE
jgi:hypothetical protein